MWIGLGDNVLEARVGHFVTWLRFAGNGFVCQKMALFDSTQAPSRRPSSAEKTRPRLGATLAPRLAGMASFGSVLFPITLIPPGAHIRRVSSDSAFGPRNDATPSRCYPRT